VTAWLGWVATGLFLVSYFSKDPGLLRRIQALAAALWIGYGVLIQATPVIVANVLVALAALVSEWRDRRERSQPLHAGGGTS
jgi:hypothetical protein